MAEGKYKITFADGSTEDVKAESRDDAKKKARTSRIREVDPAGTGERADVLKHGRVKVAKVEEYGVDITVALLVAGALVGAWLLDAWHGAYTSAYTGAAVMQVIVAGGTAIGATLAALTAVTGDSLTIPFFSESKKAWMLQLWNDVQVAGTSRVRSGKWHDDVQGIRFDTFVSDTMPLMPWGARQPIYSGDQLHVDLAGSAVAGDIEYIAMLLWFEELSAQQARLLTWDQWQARAGNYMTSENTIATGTTAAWLGTESINVEIDQFHARSEYAICGYTVDTECVAIGVRGPDTANLRTGGPGLETDREITANWFTRLAKHTGLPCIPVINGDNKAATSVEAVQDENGADTTLNFVMTELRAG